MSYVHQRQRRQLADVEVHLHHTTQAALLVSLDGQNSKAVWVPKSLVEVDGVAEIGRRVTITLPESIAIEKGLV